MKAIQYRAFGGYDESRLVDLPVPHPADGEVLIEMRTVGINPLDDTFRAGHIYMATPENLPRVGGQTGVGVVIETRAAGFAVGDRVFVTGRGFGLVADGTCANTSPRRRRAFPSCPRPRRRPRRRLSGRRRLSHRLSCADRVGKVQARADGAGAGDRRRGGNGKRAGGPAARRRIGDLDGKHDGEGRAGARRRL